MGRHSRDGGGSSNPPAPAPPRSRYAPRSAEDTGGWDRSAYRVVEAGTPTGYRAAPPPPAGAQVAVPLGAPGTGDRGALRSVPPEPAGGGGRRRAGATPADRVDTPPSRFAGGDPGGARTDSSAGLRPPGRPDPRRGLADTGAGLRPLGAADSGAGLRPLGRPDLRRGLADTGAGLRPPGAADSGAGLRPLREYGATRLGPPDTNPGLNRLAPPPPPTDRRSAADRDAVPTPTGRRSAADRDDPPARARRRSAEDRDDPPARARRRRRGADPDDAPRHGATSAGRGADPQDRPRAGATRADLVSSDTAGSTALAPRTSPEPDEVTDTGARRTRSTFHVAPEAEEPVDEEYDEPSLLLQWCIFIAQTLTGAAVGLGVWLGFFRLWSTWPFYAAPAVGVASIVMLVVARTLRRRHGRDLDLLTAILTIGIATVLTVLPAAFTLQSLA